MNRPEQRLHIAIVKWFALAAKGFKVDERTLLHFANGGKRGPIEGAIFKAMGVRAGSPDLILIIPRGSFHGLALELKSKDGRLTIEQGQMLAIFESCGWQKVIAWSFDEGVRAITNYLTRHDALKSA